MRYFMSFAVLTWFFSFVVCPLSVAGSDPVRTIMEVQKALDTADQKLFDANVDMDSLIGQCVDIFLEDAQSPEGQASLPPMLAMILSSVGKSEQAKDTLRSTLRKEAGELVRYGVRSGSYAGKPRETAAPSGMLAPFFSDASMGRKEIQSIGQAVPESGAMYVPFQIMDHGNGNTYPVEAWLRQQEGSWKVIGLRNVRTLMRLIREESSR